MHERYDFPKRRPATKIRKRSRALKTWPCAQRSVSSSVPAEATKIVLVFFETLACDFYGLNPCPVFCARVSLVANTAVGSLPSAETIKKPHTPPAFLAQFV